MKEPCFPDSYKVSSVVPVSKNVWERSMAKNYCHVRLLSAISKIFEALVNNRLADHLANKRLTYSGRTDRSGEFCYNFSISNDLTQMVNFPNRIPECDSHSPALLDLFLSSNASICSTMAFPPLGNSDVVVSVSIDFPSYSQRDAPFHRIAYDYSHDDWDGLRDHFRDVPWEDVFKLSPSAAASEFCEWVQVGMDIYIPHQKYQVKPH